MLMFSNVSKGSWPNRAGPWAFVLTCYVLEVKLVMYAAVQKSVLPERFNKSM